MFESIHRHRWHVLETSGVAASPEAPRPPVPLLSSIPRRSAFRRMQNRGAAHHAKVWTSLLRLARDNRGLMQSAIQRLSETAAPHHNLKALTALHHPPTGHAAVQGQQPSADAGAMSARGKASPPPNQRSLGVERRDSHSSVQQPHTAAASGALSSRGALFSSPVSSGVKHGGQKSTLVQRVLKSDEVGSSAPGSSSTNQRTISASDDTTPKAGPSPTAAAADAQRTIHPKPPQGHARRVGRHLLSPRHYKK